MSSKNSCEIFFEEISGSRPLSAEAITHQAGCPACRQIRQTVEAILREGAAVRPPGLHVAIKRSIISRIRFPATEPANDVGSWLRYCVAAFAVVLLVVGIWSFSKNRLATDRKPTAHEYLIVSPDGTVNSSSLARSFSQDSGSARLIAPDGSMFETIGPINIRIASRGFHLEKGTMVAIVQPGAGHFVGKTPHGQVEVLGTVFMVSVTRSNTLVKVISGKVLVTTSTGKRQTLTTSQSYPMLDLKSDFLGSTSNPIPSIDGDGPPE